MTCSTERQSKLPRLRFFVPASGQSRGSNGARRPVGWDRSTGCIAMQLDTANPAERVCSPSLLDCGWLQPPRDSVVDVVLTYNRDFKGSLLFRRMRGVTTT